MSFNAQIDNNAAAAADEAASRTGGGDFPPLPAGRYQARITENKGVDDYARSGANAGKQVVKLRVDILEDSPTGAKRVYFPRIPLFSRFAPTEKSPNGASAWLFWNFFEKVMGVSRDDILAGKPLPSNVEGKFLTIVLGKPKAPDEYNPLGSNEVQDVDAPDADLSKTPIRRPGVAVAPWLTPDDQLIPDHPSLGGGAAQRQGGQGGVPQVAWGQPAIPAASAAPAPTNVTPIAAGLPTPQWGTSPELQQAVAAGGQSF